MKTKLNCVDMKHKGAERILGKLSGLTIAEELKLWQHWSSKLLKRKEELVGKNNSLKVNA